MKLICILVTLFAASYSAPTSELSNDLRQIIFTLPLGKIHGLVTKHLEGDLEFRAALRYFQGPEFWHLVKNLQAKPSVKEAKLILQEAGLDVDYYITMATAILEAVDTSVPEGTKRSFARFLEELDPLIPYEALTQIIYDKIENSPAFKKFYDIISSDTMQNLVEKILNSAEWKKLQVELVDMDLPVDDIIKGAYEMLGWKNSLVAEPNELD